MSRPKLEDIYKGGFDLKGAGTACSCGAYIYSKEQLINHWEAGHYDVPDPPPLGVHVTDGLAGKDKVGG